MEKIKKENADALRTAMTKILNCSIETGISAECRVTLTAEGVVLVSGSEQSLLKALVNKFGGEVMTIHLPDDFKEDEVVKKYGF